MDDRTGTATGPEPGPEHRPVSVPAAAKALGISERAVRKRIHAGTLRAEPFGRSFVVWLPADAPAGPEPGPVPGPEHGPEPIEAAFTGAPALVSDAARQQLASIRDEWLAPLVAQITDQAERIGRLEAERDQLRAEVEALRSQATPAPPHEATSVPAQVEASAPPVAAGVPRSWWRRIFGG